MAVTVRAVVPTSRISHRKSKAWAIWRSVQRRKLGATSGRAHGEPWSGRDCHRPVDRTGVYHRIAAAGNAEEGVAIMLPAEGLITLGLVGEVMLRSV
jgi:hypothetical protein